MWLPQAVTPLQVEIPLTGVDRRTLGVRGAGTSRDHSGRLAGVHRHPEGTHHCHSALPGQLPSSKAAAPLAWVVLQPQH